MALLGIIRRWHLRDQISLREIAKRLGISRNTVRRYLRSETLAPAYAYRRSASALDVYAFKLSAWLKTESTKSRKQKRRLKQMHADLCVLGFEGSYDRVAASDRQWKADQLDRINSVSKGTDYSLNHGPHKKLCATTTKGPHKLVILINLWGPFAVGTGFEPVRRLTPTPSVFQTDLLLCNT